MFSDTHFHFKHFVDEHPDGAAFGADVLARMARGDVLFGLDVGTRSDDLFARVQSVQESLDEIGDNNMRAKAQHMLRFSAGIWPYPEDIRNRQDSMTVLRETVESFREEGGASAKRLVAIGEGGIDHHWNPSGADGRDRADFDDDVYEGERELFEMQLEFARELRLPFIVHSRDAFADTLDCIRNVGYDCGVIHCFSYGLAEARAFLDRGWYLAFGGAVTYTKKAQMDDLDALLAYVPDDRILLETDAPYLAPVPLRGTPNNPLNVSYTYEFIAARRKKTPAHLSKLVDRNIRDLFGI